MIMAPVTKWCQWLWWPPRSQSPIGDIHGHQVGGSCSQLGPAPGGIKTVRSDRSPQFRLTSHKFRANSVRLSASFQSPSGRARLLGVGGFSAVLWRVGVGVATGVSVAWGGGEENHLRERRKGTAALCGRVACCL